MRRMSWLYEETTPRLRFLGDSPEELSLALPAVEHCRGEKDRDPAAGLIVTSFHSGGMQWILTQNTIPTAFVAATEV